ncbi:MAG TPA: glycosyltransferase family 2 protein [Rhodocyclaceae bacterium]|nr:glycosyltransferase family 2 protein [Rhodocyclaceae bacterium]
MTNKDSLKKRDTAAMQEPAVSILIPVYNEAEVLPLCFAKLNEVLVNLDLTYELIFVDDGSNDGSGACLAALVAIQDNVKVISLSRNFGKEAAMSAGLAYTRGAATIILDADLQDPPELIPEMIQAWRAGADVVTMRRRARTGDAWHKRLSAHLYYRLLNRLSDVPIPADTGDFRLLSARAVQALNQLPERSRYMKGIFSWVGFPTTEILYERRPRAAGKTKWGYGHLMALAIEGITAFSTRPLRWASGVGVIVAGMGLSYGLFIATKTILLGEKVPGYPSLVAIIAFLGGVQLITMGILGVYVGKSYLEAKQRPVFLVKDVLQSSRGERELPLEGDEHGLA